MLSDSIHTKIVMIQRRSAWPLYNDDSQMCEEFQVKRYYFHAWFQLGARNIRENLVKFNHYVVHLKVIQSDIECKL